MTIATKNGSLIVKDGKLAENCACCGGCCGGSQSLAGKTATVTINESYAVELEGPFNYYNPCKPLSSPNATATQTFTGSIANPGRPGDNCEIRIFGNEPITSPANAAPGGYLWWLNIPDSVSLSGSGGNCQLSLFTKRGPSGCRLYDAIEFVTLIGYAWTFIGDGTYTATIYWWSWVSDLIVSRMTTSSSAPTDSPTPTGAWLPVPTKIDISVTIA